MAANPFRVVSAAQLSDPVTVDPDKEILMPATPKSSTVGSSQSDMEGLDKADPHPAEEGDPYNARGPGAGAVKPLDKDIGPNPAKHDGTAPPRPHNVETDSKP